MRGLQDQQLCSLTGQTLRGTRGYARRNTQVHIHASPHTLCKPTIARTNPFYPYRCPYKHPSPVYFLPYKHPSPQQRLQLLLPLRPCGLQRPQLPCCGIDLHVVSTRGLRGSKHAAQQAAM